jgi:hypothetical protein
MLRFQFPECESSGKYIENGRCWNPENKSEKVKSKKVELKGGNETTTKIGENSQNSD